MEIGDQQIDRLLDRPVAYHRVFVDIAGSVHGAVMLSQAVFWNQRTPAGRDGWWWKTYREWHAETGLTRGQVDGARKALVAAGVMEFRSVGFPRKCWYRIDPVALSIALEQALGAAPRDTDVPSLFDSPNCDDASLPDYANCDDPEQAAAPDTSLTPCSAALCPDMQTVRPGTEPSSLLDCANCAEPSLPDSAPSLLNPAPSLRNSYTQFAENIQTDLTKITTEITPIPPPAPRARASPDDHQSPDPNPIALEIPAWLRRDADRHAQTAVGPAFALAADWEPGPQFADRCAMFGLPGAYTADQLGEFISFWSAEASIARQGQWEHRFLSRLKRDHLKSTAAGADRHAPRRSLDATGIDLHDTSWLDADTIAYVESGFASARRDRGEPGV